MKFVKIEWNSEWRGFWIDPSAYLSELGNIKDELPKGARAFATLPGHYDLGSRRCVKDLGLVHANLVSGGDASLDIAFRPNEWKHDSGLVVSYVHVRRFDLAVGEAGSGLEILGTVLLDEILTLDGGCTHEIVFTGGRISIHCADLNASWE